MTPTQLEAARRLAESGRMRWIPGMADWVGINTAGCRVVAIDTDPDARFPICIYAITTEWNGSEWMPTRGLTWVTREAMSRCTPDLADPATVGCLLAQAREEYPDATTQLDSGVWWLAARNGHELGRGPSEVEAIVAAILGAP